MTEAPVVRRRAPPPKPEEVPFVAALACPPLALAAPEPGDRALAARRAKAEHLCLWLGCSRALCRRARHCLGPHAACLAEMAEVAAPLLG